MRQKILDESRRLFNLNGYTQTSQRMISDHLKISPGNLTYHFKRKDDLVKQHYEDLVESISKGIPQPSANLMKTAITGTRTMYQSLFDYRFFMIEFVYFMRAFPEIGKHFNELMQIRNTQFGVLFDALRQDGLIIDELQLGHDLELFNLMYLIGNFWISQEAVTGQLNEQSVQRGVTALQTLLLPYLTDKGVEQFKAVMYGSV
ncbi:MAG: TetR family transcriptional regulator [Cyclobacteriaceae bacterium]